MMINNPQDPTRVAGQVLTGSQLALIRDAIDQLRGYYFKEAEKHKKRRKPANWDEGYLASAAAVQDEAGFLIDVFDWALDEHVDGATVALTVRQIG